MKKILIVEDEYRIRTGLSRLIEKLDMGGRVVGEAEDGLEGLKMIQEREPDIVIADIEMPHMDGLTMIERAREMRFDCVFVILSGYADFKFAQRAVGLGVSEYLLKPITISEVKKLLEKVIPEEPSVDADKNLQEKNYSPVIQKMLETIRKQYGKHLGLETFAEEYHLTPQYLSSLFTKETGKSFSSYLRMVRMEKARELLMTTDMKIFEVACAVGYPDQKYFSKVFRECTGVSAKQYAMGIKSKTGKDQRSSSEWRNNHADP